MGQPLPTNTGIITARLLKAAVALQVGVYEFKEGTIDDTEAFKGIEAAAKEIERLTRALRKTF
jgi:hypothetical protein